MCLAERARGCGHPAARRGAQPDRHGPLDGAVEADRGRDAGEIVGTSIPIVTLNLYLLLV